MEAVTLIKVETLDDLLTLEMNQNFLCIVTTTGEWLRGDSTNPAIKIMDDNSSNFATHFLLMGA